MRIAVTGAEGRLGSELIRRGCIPLDCDITDEESVKAQLDMVMRDADTIINCAAYTKVDEAEGGGYEEAIAVNIHGVGNLRRNWLGHFVHISTGFVFDGTKDSGLYDEEDSPNPLGHYAYTKLAGEAAAQMRTPSLIIRTLNLFGSLDKSDFVTEVLDQLEKGEVIKRPDNLFGNPTYVPALADAILSILKSTQLRGIINLAGTSFISRYEFSKLIARVFGYDENLVQPSEILGAAKRPLRAGLDVSRASMINVPLISADVGLLRFKESLDAQREVPI